MFEPVRGLGTGDMSSSGDDFLRLTFTYREATDLGAVLGAEPAPNIKYREVRNAVIVAIVLASWANPSRWIAYSRDRNDYSMWRWYFGSLASYKFMVWAVDTLLKAGLIEHRKTRPSPSARFRSTLRATKKLLADVPIESMDDLKSIAAETIRLRDLEGKLIAYEDDQQISAWRSDAAEQNEALNGVCLRLTSQDWSISSRGLLHDGNRSLNPARMQLYRVFNCDWRNGGRWYGAWWQNLSSSDRSLLTIDNEPVAELDYAHLHPTLLAAIAGIDLGNQDPYLIHGFQRREIKLTFNILVNARSEKSAVLALQEKLIGLGRDRPRHRALGLVEAIKIYHSKFAFAWGTGFGLRLQNIDADMCAEVQRLMRLSGRPVLSVHDSFIVGASAEPALEAAMDEVIERVKRSLAGTDMEARR